MKNIKMSDVFDLPIDHDFDLTQRNNEIIAYDFRSEYDAAAICLAVNSHDKLVEALEVVDVYLKDNTTRLLDPSDMRMRLMVIAALREIRGE